VYTLLASFDPVASHLPSGEIAVTVAMFLDNKLTLSVALLYIVVQLCGAYGAYIFNNYVLKNKI